MGNNQTRTAESAVLATVGNLGEESATELFTDALPLMRARLASMRSAQDVDSASLAASESLASVRVYGSENLEVLLTGLLEKRFPVGELPDTTANVCAELTTSIEAIENWLYD